MTVYRCIQFDAEVSISIYWQRGALSCALKGTLSQCRSTA